MRLSDNFTLSEFTYSQTAIRLGLKNEPNMQQIQHLALLSMNVLEKVRSHFNSAVIVSSGYRSPQLNRAIGGATSSAHQILHNAAAADIHVLNHKNQEVFDWIRNNLEFDQVILEGVDANGNSGWVHVALDSVNNRKQALKATFHNGIAHYEIIS